MPQPQPEPISPAQRRAMLVFLGGFAVMLIGWGLGFSLRVPLWDADPSTIARPPVMRDVFGAGISSMTNTGLIIGVVSAGYLAALWALRRGFRYGFPAAVAASAILALALLPMRPLASPDVTHLAADVRTLWLHHEYPTSFKHAPGKIDDPVAREVLVYTNSPSGYGPIAYGIGGLPIPFVGDGLAANVAGQKFIAGLFLVIAAAATGFVARRLGTNAGLAAGFVGLNPLMLFEFAGDGHNDSIMVAFSVLALFYLLEREWADRGIGLVVAAGAVLSKFSIAIAAPLVFTSWFPRFRIPLAALFTIAGIIATVVIMSGHGPRFATLGPATAVSLTTPANVLSHWLELGSHGRDIVVGLGYGLWAVALGAILFRHRLDTPQELIAASALAIWLFVFLGSAGTLPWYQSWYLPFAALSGKRWLVAASLVFSIGGFAPILSLHWTNDLARQLNVSRPVDVVVLALWLATGLVALALWVVDSGRGPRTEVRSRQSVRAQRRRQARRTA